MEESKRLELLRNFNYDISIVRPQKWNNLKVNLADVRPGSYSEKLVQAGIEIPKEIFLAFVMLSGLIVGYLGYLVGPMLGIYSYALFCYYLSVNYIAERAQKRRKQVVPQIPSFLDGLTASLNTGYSIDAALLQGAQSIPHGLLRSELENSINLLNSGMTVDEAFKRPRQKISGREIVSIITAIDLFSSMGGRMLDPFERLGKKLREQESALSRASRDLVQIKQAFIIIVGLSVLAPLGVFLGQPGYIMTAFNDEFGRLILQIAIMVELTAIFVFKNMLNLKI